MSLIGFVKKFSTIIIAIIALLLTRIGLSYLLVLILMGLVVSFVYRNRSDAIISAILYAVIGFVYSFPAGMFLSNYMPSIDIPVHVTFMQTVTNLAIGLLVPLIISVVIVALSGEIGLFLSEKIRGNRDEEDNYNDDEHYFNILENFENNSKRKNTDEEYDEDILEYSPIQRAILKNQKKFKKE